MGDMSGLRSEDGMSRERLGEAEGIVYMYLFIFWRYPCTDIEANYHWLD